MNFGANEDPRAMYLAEIRAERKAIRDLKKATISGDLAKFDIAFTDARYLCILPRALRALAGL